jgi:hypothetical protein
MSPNAAKNLGLLALVAVLGVLIFSDASLPVGLAVLAATGAAAYLLLVFARRSERG